MLLLFQCTCPCLAVSFSFSLWGPQCLNYQSWCSEWLCCLSHHCPLSVPSLAALCSGDCVLHNRTIYGLPLSAIIWLGAFKLAAVVWVSDSTVSASFVSWKRLRECALTHKRQQRYDNCPSPGDRSLVTFKLTFNLLSKRRLASFLQWMRTLWMFSFSFFPRSAFLIHFYVKSLIIGFSYVWAVFFSSVWNEMSLKYS